MASPQPKSTYFTAGAALLGFVALASLFSPSELNPKTNSESGIIEVTKANDIQEETTFICTTGEEIDRECKECNLAQITFYNDNCELETDEVEDLSCSETCIVIPTDKTQTNTINPSTTTQVPLVLEPTPIPVQPTPEPQPAPLPIPVPQPTPASQQQYCCKHCSKGKACGDSCISRDKVCHQPPGCACDS
ncbi:hypothetical protein KC678_04610 [Candidatus Dojkabacteria bacterium]|uniref:Uncharacterized protein n=1 Tax=Candidatus Dojkabacteria bacterium TaxID=2099670 RepID=A0A955RGU9_9BACT|nr:hypothetical protein [Candidatus Dojkabacteria bacterium]